MDTTLSDTRMMQDIFRLTSGSCRLYAETQWQQAMLAVAAGVILAAGFTATCIVWTRLFNRSYGLSALEWTIVTFASVFGFALLQLLLALGFAGNWATAEIKGYLKDMSEDNLAMMELRTRVHDYLNQGDGGGLQDPATPPSEARWRFTAQPDDASILSIAEAYSNALAAVISRENSLISGILSWDITPGFLAADIRLHATRNPEEPYDLDPGNAALAEILTMELAARIRAYVLATRVVCAAILMVLMITVLVRLGLSAYRDIRVHWPGGL